MHRESSYVPVSRLCVANSGALGVVLLPVGRVCRVFCVLLLVADPQPKAERRVHLLAMPENRNDDGHNREQMRGIMVGMGNVSVVITSYNQNEMIREAVDSVRRQTLRPDAIIVVDDGSTDPASVQVLDELEQADDITVVRQGNAGPSAARNVGIRAARTDCVTVLDGDDRLLPTFLATTVGLLDGDASAVATSGWLRTFGVLDAVVKPTGGTIADFLPRNAGDVHVPANRLGNMRRLRRVDALRIRGLGFLPVVAHSRGNGGGHNRDRAGASHRHRPRAVD